MAEKMSFQRDYKASLTEQVSNASTGEIEFQLNKEPQSEIGFLLIDKGSDNQESVFFHRKVGASVFAYGANRSNPVVHEAQTQVLLVSSIEAMNYLSELSFDQFYLYKKDASSMIITGGTVYVNGTNVEIAEVDTSLNKENQILITGTKNYVYVDQGQIRISNEYDSKRYTLGEIDVGVSGNIEEYRNYKIFPLGQYNADGLYNLDSLIFIESGGIQTILDEGIKRNHLENDIISTEKILNNAIVAAKIATDAVETAKIKNLNVTTEKINTHAIIASKIAENAVTTIKILNAAVTSDKLATDSVITSKIKALNVTKGKLEQSIQDTLDKADHVYDLIEEGGIGDSFLANDGTYKVFPDASYISDTEITSAKIWSSEKTNNRIEEAEAKAVTVEGNQDVKGYKNMINGVVGNGSDIKKHILGEDMDTKGIVVSLGSDGKLYKGGQYYGLLQTTGITGDEVYVNRVDDKNQTGLIKGSVYGYNPVTGEIQYGDDFIADSETQLTYVGNVYGNELIKGLVPGEILKGELPLTNEVMDYVAHTHEFEFRYTTTYFGQTFTVPEVTEEHENFNINTFNIRYGSYYNGHVCNWHFRIYTDITKTTLVYDYGQFTGADGNNSLKKYDVSASGLQPGTEYYAEVQRISGSSSYYIRMRYNNTLPYTDGKMYVDGVESIGNTMAFSVDYEYQRLKDKRLIALRYGSDEYEDPTKVYGASSSAGSNFAGYYEGTLEGYTDPTNDHVASLYPVYGSNVIGGVFSHSQNEVSRITLKGESVGISTFDVEVYGLDGNGDIDTGNKLGESLGNNNTIFPSPESHTIGDSNMRSGTYTTPFTYVVQDSKTYRFGGSLRSSSTSGTVQMRVMLDGVQLYYTTTNATGFTPFDDVVIKAKKGQTITMQVRVTNDSYYAYWSGITLESVGENATVEFTNPISISPNTNYGYMISGTGDASNYVSIANIENDVDEVIEIFNYPNLVNMYNHAAYAVRGVVGNASLGLQTVTISMTTFNSGGSWCRGQLRQNGATIGTILGTTDTNQAATVFSATFDVDFSLGEVTWEDQSNTDSSQSYGSNRVASYNVYHKEGFKESLTKENLRVFSRPESDVKVPNVSGLKKGLFFTEETLEKGTTYFIDNLGNISTESGIELGPAIGEHIISLLDSNKGFFDNGVLGQIGTSKNQTSMPNGITSSASVYFEKDTIANYKFNGVVANGQFKYYIEKSEDNINWKTMNETFYNASSTHSADYILSLRGGMYYRVSHEYVSGSTTASQNFYTNLYFSN